jgi:hypothetical protein
MADGPVQMLVDDIGDVTITNDGATILKMLEVEHPAAKVGLTLWMLSFLQRMTCISPHWATFGELQKSPDHQIRLLAKCCRNNMNSGLLSYETTALSFWFWTDWLGTVFEHWLGTVFEQVLVELAELQDKEVGDGTTSVVIIAAELLKVGIQAWLHEFPRMLQLYIRSFYRCWLMH